MTDIIKKITILTKKYHNYEVKIFMLNTLFLGHPVFPQKKPNPVFLSFYKLSNDTYLISKFDRADNGLLPPIMLIQPSRNIFVSRFLLIF